MDTDFPATFLRQNSDFDTAMNSGTGFPNGWKQAGASSLSLETQASHSSHMHEAQTMQMHMDQQSSVFGQGPANVAAHSAMPGAGTTTQYYGRNNTGYPSLPASLDTNLPLENLLHIPSVKKIYEEYRTVTATFAQMVSETLSLREEIARLKDELDCIRRVQGPVSSR